MSKLYCRYDIQRISACLLTIHLLLHLAESLLNCGPAWVYWQFPCERVCGMLKPKAKNRSLANRNLSLAILYQEQYNHLPFATSSYRHCPLKEKNLEFTNQIDGHSYSFFRPQKLHELSRHVTSHLVVYYANLFDRTTAEIDHDHFDPNITKYARCLLANDIDGISSEWYESRRNMVVSTRISSVMCFSQKGDEGGLVRQY